MPMPELLDDPDGVPDYAVLSVDLNGLSDVAAALRREVDGNLLRHITQLNSAYSMGVDFGSASHSDNVKQARRVYRDCLVQATNLLSSYVTAGEVLATAIDDVVRRYGSSDAMASARVDDVDTALKGARRTVPVHDVALQVEHFSGRKGSFE
jgi:hypothetical protein